MKLVLYNDFQLGVLQDNQVIDVSAVAQAWSHHSPQEMMQFLIRDWETVQPQIQQASQGKVGRSLDSVRMRAPLPRPGQFVCLAGNYLEPQKPERGLFNAFLKSSSSVIGLNDTVELPATEASVFHFEPELAVVIGKPASRLRPEEALDYVFGYTQFIDVSARGLPGGFFLGKSWHTFGPLGPVLVTKDEIADANQLPIKLWVNDELRHDFSTAEMDRHLPELLAEVTNVLALEPGDVVATGTHHYALAPIQNGDVVRLQIDGLGPALVVRCQDPLNRTW